MSALTPDQIRQKVTSLGDWFHNIDLGGVKTAPNHFLQDYPSNKFARFRHAVPEDLTGKSVLDIGCNSGFYSIEMKKRGAERVVGVDTSAWLAELALHDDLFRTLAHHLPSELSDTKATLRNRLAA